MALLPSPLHHTYIIKKWARVIIQQKCKEKSLIVNNIGHQGGYIHEGKKPVLNLQTNCEEIIISLYVHFG